ncbi:MAG: tetratricopeptide repeat protein [Calditrichota bacterium]
MNRRFLTIMTIGILAATTTLWFAGCGGKAKPGDEVEMFAQAQEFQKDEKYEDAVRTYRQIVSDFPKTRQAINGQFMVGYIYANHIKDYEQAKIELNRFIDNFGSKADSGLVAGARFELKYLGKSIDEIPILTDTGGDTATTSNESLTP